MKLCKFFGHKFELIWCGLPFTMPINKCTRCGYVPRTLDIKDNMTLNQNGQWEPAKPLRCPTWIEVKIEALVDFIRDTK